MEQSYMEFLQKFFKSNNACYKNSRLKNGNECDIEAGHIGVSQFILVLDEI